MANQEEWKVSAAQMRKSHGFSEKKTKSNMKEQAAETEVLAAGILTLARNTLRINLHFLESAFVRFVPGRDIITGELVTDGQFLYYNSVHICRQFQKGRQFVVRDYLHLVFHCLYRHLFAGKSGAFMSYLFWKENGRTVSGGKREFPLGCSRIE